MGVSLGKGAHCRRGSSGGVEAAKRRKPSPAQEPEGIAAHCCSEGEVRSPQTWHSATWPSLGDQACWLLEQDERCHWSNDVCGGLACGVSGVCGRQGASQRCGITCPKYSLAPWALPPAPWAAPPTRLGWLHRSRPMGRRSHLRRRRSCPGGSAGPPKASADLLGASGQRSFPAAGPGGRLSRPGAEPPRVGHHGSGIAQLGPRSRI